MSETQEPHQPIRVEDNSQDQHIIGDVYDGVEDVDKPVETAQSAQPVQATTQEEGEHPEQGEQPAPPAKEEAPTNPDSDKATKEKVDAMSIMFPTIDKEIIASVLQSSSTQERAVETLLQMSDPAQSTTTPSRPVSQIRQMNDDEALARRLQELDFERNGRASSTPYDDLGYEPRRPRRREENDHERLHEQADSLEPGFNFSDITNAFSELAWTSKKHLDEFWSSMTETFNGESQGSSQQQEQQHPQQPPQPRKVKVDNPYDHHYDPAIHRRAKQNNRQSMMQSGRSADFSNLGFLPRREIDLSQHKRNNSSAQEEEEDEYTHNPFNERK